ncbi:MAG TPA: sulfurtransferase TusA family protein [Candidatus Dormibacteraeota bacterium]|nr:sulfurtransferase TusA family protein [Candidatus Dormibacteraeota bacterium]
MSQSFDRLFDARGLNCPMPLVNARKQAGQLETGQILKVIASDAGSMADFQGWVKIARNVELLGQETESMDGESVYIHYIKRIA